MQLTAGGRLQIWNAHLQRPSRSRSNQRRFAGTPFLGPAVSTYHEKNCSGRKIQFSGRCLIGATATLAADMRYLVGAAIRPALASKRGVFQEVAGETVRVPLDSIAAP
jgi:hypothetical protein